MNKSGNLDSDQPPEVFNRQIGRQKRNHSPIYNDNMSYFIAFPPQQLLGPLVHLKPITRATDGSMNRILGECFRRSHEELTK